MKLELGSTRGTPAPSRPLPCPPPVPPDLDPAGTPLPLTLYNSIQQEPLSTSRLSFRSHHNQVLGLR
eukprot:scaffold17296_cov99-Phaeocystis_antarctica.AAC.1